MPTPISPARAAKVEQILGELKANMANFLKNKPTPFNRTEPANPALTVLSERLDDTIPLGETITNDETVVLNMLARAISDSMPSKTGKAVPLWVEAPNPRDIYQYNTGMDAPNYLGTMPNLPILRNKWGSSPGGRPVFKGLTPDELQNFIRWAKANKPQTADPLPLPGDHPRGLDPRSYRLKSISDSWVNRALGSRRTKKENVADIRKQYVLENSDELNDAINQGRYEAYSMTPTIKSIIRNLLERK